MRDKSAISMECDFNWTLNCPGIWIVHFQIFSGTHLYSPLPSGGLAPFPRSHGLFCSISLFVFSGISNESPETHSSGEHHLHPFPAHRASPHAHFTSTPPVMHSPPRSPVVPGTGAHAQHRDAEDPQLSQAHMDHHCK